MRLVFKEIGKVNSKSKIGKHKIFIFSIQNLNFYAKSQNQPINPIIHKKSN